jgi:single-stranded-DNA-specific exonuclease
MSFVKAHERVVVKPFDAEVVARLAAELSIAPAVAQILATRNLTTFEQCERFFNPSLAGLHDPFLFAHMRIAVDRIIEALRRREKIVIYGDYDVDGVTATALLVRVLGQLGAAVEYYLPHRLSEGYGISCEAVRTIAAGGATLLISVDCGITACEEVALARSLGMDVIVSDHHEPKERLPAATALLDPKAPGSGYPEVGLAGVGVALKLCQALCSAAGAEERLWQDCLDLVALGTAADIVPLTGENRAIVAEGLRRLAESQNPGLRALLREQGLEGTALVTHHVVFQVAPCINAAGRIGDPRRAVELLLTDDPALAAAYARELAEANRQRRALNEQVELEAVAWVEEHCSPARDVAIVAGAPGWHAGVIGIVASKLVERYYRPAILFSLADGVAHGSGRTVPGLHLLDALTECADLLESFGGHAAAAGMSIRVENLPEFRRRFNEAVRVRLGGGEPVPTIQADTEVSLAELTPKMLRIIERMQPFGPGNMRPVMLCRGLAHSREPRVVGGGGHLKLCVRGGGAVMDAIGFGFGDRLEELRAAGDFGLAFCLDENEWNGRKSLQMRIKGVAV